MSANEIWQILSLPENRIGKRNAAQQNNKELFSTSRAERARITQTQTIKLIRFRALVDFC